MLQAMRHAARAVFLGRRAAIAACVALSWIVLAGSAQARWLRAESDHFVVYSNGDEGVLRDYVTRLETFQWTLRFMHGIPQDDPVSRKLDLYLVHDVDQLREVWPEAPDNIAGFYSASEDDIISVAIRQRRDDNSRVQHEYTHHFMFQYFPYGYPSWLVEGYAEYFSTVEVKGREVDVGEPGERASQLLFDKWMPLADVLGKPLATIPEERMSMYYAEAWAMTHYMMSDPARSKQLHAYMVDVGHGADPVRALEAQTGQSVAALDAALQRYIHGGLHYSKIMRPDTGPARMTVTILPPSADAFLLAQHQIPRADKTKEALLRRLAEKAAAFPDDRLAELTLAEAQTRLGDRNAGEARLKAWLTAHPGDADALRILALSRMAAGDADPPSRQAFYREAGRYLAQANKSAPDDYRILYAYGRSRSVEPDFPSDNTLNVFLLAHQLAPQVEGVSIATAQALMSHHQFVEALALLQPVANDPHADAAAKVAQALAAEAQSRLTPAAHGLSAAGAKP